MKGWQGLVLAAVLLAACVALSGGCATHAGRELPPVEYSLPGAGTMKT